MGKTLHKSWKDNNKNTHSGIIVAFKNGYNAIECEKCGFIHIIPLPSDKELHEYYKDIFTDYSFSEPVAFNDKYLMVLSSRAE